MNNWPSHQNGPPTWKEVESTVHRARTASALGPNGVPCKVYKVAPNVLRILWGLMRTAWQKKMVPKVWHRACGVLIPKEKDAVNITLFRPISWLNMEGKIFFIVIAQRMAEYLQRNNYIVISEQRARILGLSGCLQHSSMIWHQIHLAKVGGPTCSFPGPRQCLWLSAPWTPVVCLQLLPHTRHHYSPD